MRRLGYILRITLMAAVISAGLLSVSRGELSAQLTTPANNNPVEIGFFYHGSSVTIEGVSDKDRDLIIKITSEGGHHSLRQKGKVGVLWMNVGTLKFEHVPVVYFIESTKKISDILSPSEQLSHGIGYKALQEEAEVTPLKNPSGKEKWFTEFLKYKEKSKVYAVTSGKISLDQKDGKQKYKVTMDWPYQAPPGKYLVTVYSVKDMKVVEEAKSEVSVQKVGIVKSLTGMATNNAAFYGFISVLVALGAGFGVGLIFRKGGGGH